MDKTTDKVKETTNEAKGAVSDSWLTSKTKIALFADDRVKGKDVRGRDDGRPGVPAR
jgi:osmotically-inducible protein OsmY